MYSVVVLCLIFFALLGCATPARLKIPSNHFRTPEVRGQFASGSVDLRWIGVVDIKVVDSIIEATPQTTPDVNENGGVGANISFGLGRRVDFYYTATEAFPNLLGLKLQIFGDTQQVSKKGNWSLSLAGAYATGTYNTEKEVSDDVSGEVSANATSDYSGYEAVVSVGYRFSDSALIYLAPFYYRLAGVTSVERTVGSTTTVTVNPEGEGESAGVSLGLHIGKKHLFLKVEGSLASSKWIRLEPVPEQEDEGEEAYAGLALGAGW